MENYVISNCSNLSHSTLVEPLASCNKMCSNVNFGSHIDKWYIRFVMGFPLKAVQGSHSAGPMCRGWGNIGEVPKL